MSRHSHDPGPERTPSLQTDTRTLLIQKAKKLFAAKGYDGTTVKEIADLAQVNVSLISYHFEGKEGLYRACLELLGKARLAVARRVLQSPQSPEEFQIRFKLFIFELLSGHIEEPELSRIVSRECDMGFPIARDIFNHTFLKIFETLIEFFRSAQEQEILRKDLNLNIVVSLIFGGLQQLSLRDDLHEYYFHHSIKDPSYLNQVVETSLSFFLEGCLNHRKSSKRASGKAKPRSPRNPKNPKLPKNLPKNLLRGESP